MNATEYKVYLTENYNKVMSELQAMNWQSKALNKFNMLMGIVQMAVLYHPGMQYHFDKDLFMPIYELKLAERVDVMGFGTVGRLVCSDKGSYLSVGNAHSIANLKDVCTYEELNEIVEVLMDEYHGF